jgi:sugar O-acyltransferase (sialic acid O-acetyltransferase NeuD family)
MQPVVIFGIGSPLAIDAEETCLRLGLRIIAGIRNVAGPSYVTDRVAIVAADEATDAMKDCPVILPMFTPAHRKTASEDARRRGFRSAMTAIDPTSVIASSASLGAGVFINAGCTIGGASTFGELALVNRGANLGHHVQLDDFVSIGPGAVLAGSVRVGRGAVIGAGAVVLPKVEIGANAVIGAGAVVTGAVWANCLAVGNPARIVKRGIAGFNDLGV